jgi:hypothetical protein
LVNNFNNEIWALDLSESEKFRIKYFDTFCLGVTIVPIARGCIYQCTGITTLHRFRWDVKPGDLQLGLPRSGFDFKRD